MPRSQAAADFAKDLLRKLLRVKVEDGNDLLMAIDTVNEVALFFERLQAHADATGRVNFQTFKRVVLHGLKKEKNQLKFRGVVARRGRAVRGTGCDCRRRRAALAPAARGQAAPLCPSPPSSQLHTCNCA